MYASPFLIINSPTAKDIGYTSDFFESGLIWKKLPFGFYVNTLKPKGNKTESVKQLFQKIHEKGFLVNYVCPPTEFAQVLLELGFVKHKDSAGSVFYQNFTKTSEGKIQRIKELKILQSL